MSISLPADAISRFDLLYKKAASLGLDCGQFGEKLPTFEPIYIDVEGVLQQVDSTVNGKPSTNPIDIFFRAFVA